ncbi:DUF2312 domain-containing protein [Roseospirillum parvum]|uniref:UPF0335 protein SAMN05421742_10357 n=1 Tax=Roseospirillum parvum TaxID=83401 RepID=A0A1G7XQE3_9PROT|nr:DUF2312 domain-containing protein [Roseospirillum parvum]SDG86253.1 Uncharacterized conserved protein, UPF0335 family [Roseospirillum parvum]
MSDDSPTFDEPVDGQVARPTNVGGVAGDQLRSLVERIERLEEEKKNLMADIKDVYAEAKGNGFDTKIIRKIVSLRKKEDHERREEEELLAVYQAALGMD